MTKWAEGEDRILMMAKVQPKKQELLVKFLELVGEPVGHLKKEDAETQTWEIKGDNRRFVECINGEVKQAKHKGIIVKAQRKLKQLWEEGWDLARRSGNWARHIFREHNTVADRWAVCRCVVSGVGVTEKVNVELGFGWSEQCAVGGRQFTKSVHRCSEVLPWAQK